MEYSVNSLLFCCTSRTCSIFLFPQVNDDSDEKRLPDPSKEIHEDEWKEEWSMDVKGLARCYQKNRLYSACPNMARGEIVKARDVRNILEQHY